MRRRRFLASAALGAIGGAGCSASIGRDCPDPGIEEEMTYETRDPEGSLFRNPDREGVFLATSAAHADRFDAYTLDEEVRQWGAATDFEEAAVLGLQIRASEESSPLLVRGIGREDEETVHVHTCMDRGGDTLYWEPFTRLLRLSRGGQAPTTAKLTHWYDGDERTFEESCDIGCFDFTHIGADDVPDKLTIEHLGGRNLPVEEVFITNVVVEHGRNTETVIETVAWHEVDDHAEPGDWIVGKEARVDIDFPDVVQVLWRREGEVQVLDETRAFR